MQTFLGGAALYAHNAPYDRRMLDLEFGLLQLPPLETVAKRVVCTLAESYKRLPGLSGRKLDHLCDHYGIDRSGRGQHGALVDCELLTG